MKLGNNLNFGIEWARRNLDNEMPGAGKAAAAAPPWDSGYGSYAGNPAKRARTYGGDIVTIAIVGMKEKGISATDVEDWFNHCPGYVMHQANERIGSLFVKFDS